MSSPHSYHDCQELLAESVTPVTDLTVASHVAYQGNLKFFTVPVSKNTSFWTEYCELLASGKDMYIGEVVKEAAPVFSHFIFRLPLVDENDDLGEGISNNFIQGLVAKYQEAIAHIIDLDSDEHETSYVTVVTESEEVWYEEHERVRYWCIEFRLHFPYCKVETRYLSKIRNHAIKLLSTCDINTVLERSFYGDWNGAVQAIDKSLPLYGSVQVKGRPRLSKYKIYPRMDYSVSVKGEADTLELADLFYPMSHVDFSRNTNLVQSRLFENLTPDGQLPEEDLEQCLPLFLSVNYCQQIQNSRSGSDIQTSHVRTSKSLIGAGETPNAMLTSEPAQGIAEDLLRMIKPYRYLQETYWRDIGAALYSSFKGDDNGLRTWIKHSRRAQGNDQLPEFISRFGSLEEAATREYPTFENSGISVKTLGTYALQDNPKEYATWHKDWVAETYEKAIDGEDNDIAHSVYRAYWLDFRYAPSSSGGGKWWYFENNRWIHIEEGLKLKKLLSGDFKRKFEMLRTAMSKDAEGLNDKRNKANIEYSINLATKVIKKLGSNGAKNRIFSECREFFADPDFASRLDTKPNLTGMLNGVIEVIGVTAFFRQGKPEDYISLSTRVKYYKDYSWEHPLVRECTKWFLQAFHTQELYDFFMKFASSGLVAGNIDKVFMLWTGVGNNSKSMLVKLFENAFGEYTKSLPYTVFSDKGSNSGAANPQIARLAGCRWAVTMEPSTDSGFTLNAGHIKRLTGNDKQYARKLHENGGEITMTYKTIYQCNDPPQITGADNATRNRTVDLRFGSRWGPIKQLGQPDILPPESEEEQKAKRHYKEDEMFDRRIPGLASAFIWMCVQYFPRYMKEKLGRPQEVMLSTQEFWRETDTYELFHESEVETVMCGTEINKNAEVGVEQLYASFKTWYEFAFPRGAIPDMPSFSKQYSTRFGRPVKKKWVGIRLKRDNSEMAGGMMQPVGNVPSRF